MRDDTMVTKNKIKKSVMSYVIGIIESERVKGAFTNHFSDS